MALLEFAAATIWMTVVSLLLAAQSGTDDPSPGCLLTVLPVDC